MLGEPIPGLDGDTREWRCGVLARTLVERGHRVTFWASTFSHALRRHRFTGSKVVDLESGVRVRLLRGPGYRKSNSIKRLLHHAVVATAFERQALCLERPDLIFCCLPTLELAEKSVLYGKRVGAPVIVDIRDLWPDHYLTLVPKLLRSAFRLALQSEFDRAKRSLGGATGITAISKSFLNWGLQYAGRTQRPADGVFPLGYPSADSSEAQTVGGIAREIASQFGFSEGQFLVIFVGTFSPSFNFETVFEAARLLGGDGVRFVMVGGGDAEASLRLRGEGLANVTFTGWLDRLSVRAVLSLSAVGLAPYRKGVSMTLPNKPFEYMAAGIPILSSLEGELKELVSAEGIGLNYEAGDASSLVEAVRYFASSHSACLEMGGRARKLFEREYNYEALYPRLARHLEEVVLSWECDSSRAEPKS